MKIKRFEELVCWRAARSLVKMIYNVLKQSEKFNKDFRLVGQATSSAVSVMSNIAEGFSRHSNKEFIQFLFISKASLAELQSILYVALDLEYISHETFQAIYNQAETVAKLESRFITYLLSTKTKRTKRTQQTQQTQQTLKEIDMEQRNEKKEEYIFSFEKLEVWQCAVDLADVTLDLMESFPANRCYRIVGQMEAAVSSVAQHIAEGKGRQQKNEFINCLYSAKGSICEVLTLTRILTRRGLVNTQEEMKIKRQAEIVERKLYGLINFLRGKADN